MSDYMWRADTSTPIDTTGVTLQRIATALEELVRLHVQQADRLDRHELERQGREQREIDAEAASKRYMVETTEAMQRSLATQEAMRKDNQEHLAKCEKRYLARLAGDEPAAEVQH